MDSYLCGFIYLIDSMVYYMERPCFMEIWKKQPVGMVYCNSSNEYCWDPANYLSEVFPEEKEVIESAGYFLNSFIKSLY